MTKDEYIDKLIGDIYEHHADFARLSGGSTDYMQGYTTALKKLIIRLWGDKDKFS